MKSRLAARMPAKLYWHLMGRFRAVPAVTSQFSRVEDSLESGRDIVDLLERLDVLGRDVTTLHIGSGIGRVEYHLAPRVARCFGADISRAMVDKARALVPWDNVEFVCTDGQSLDRWDDQSLDLVLSFFVFQHMPRATFRSYLTHSLDKLKAGGALVFQVMVDEDGLEPEPPTEHPYALRHYERDAVRSQLANVGFVSVRILEMDGSPDAGGRRGDLIFVGRRP